MSHSTSRREILQASAALLIAPPVPDSTNVPAAVQLYTESGVHPLARNGNRWQASGIEVTAGPVIRLQCPAERPLRLHLRWNFPISSDLRILGDAWERSYGDLAFRNREPERILPWYALLTDDKRTQAFGVKTGAAAFCFWQIDPEGVSLWCDVRNGGRGLQLGSRELAVAELVTQSYADRNAFQAARDFCRLLCPRPRLPKEPIYGGNNWYYAYGHSSASDILADSERVASVSQSNVNRPWMVIDDGWEVNPLAGPWRQGNARFPDMPKLAADMQKAGVQPGIWMRPLFTREPIVETARLRPFTLDPTHPEAAALIAQDLQTVVSWGFRLVKHDFSTFDLLGRWGFQMNAELTDAKWNFQDQTKTTAEIIRDFYLLLRKAAGDAMLLGCNTVGHLGAGVFEAQRIGDDTSGRDWNRTRKMGVNTLAFRLPQHNTFFAIDADCVGLTKQIAWPQNRQWLDLLARSGSPLFVSIAPDAWGEEQKQAVREAFQMASQKQDIAEPSDWLTNNQPQHWRAAGREFHYDWFGTEGASPFST